MCSEVLASTDHSIRFSPVVGARCRPPMSKITLLHPLWAKRCELYEILPPIASKATTKMKLRIWCGRILARANCAPDFRHRQAQAETCAVTKGTGYATYSAGGRGASAAGPEIPKEAGPRRRAQRRGAGDAGGIPTRSMRPHRRTDARSYAERGIAGGAGMRRSAANAPRATAGCIGPTRNGPMRKAAHR